MNRRKLLWTGAAIAAGTAGLVGLDLLLKESNAPEAGLIDGVVWQVNDATLDPHGEWNRLGARSLLLQWIVADGKAYVPGLGLPTVEDPPDWKRIAGEPWAQSIIVGLATELKEPEARRDVAALAALSARIAAQPLPFTPAGYYFPVEVDPTWLDAPKMAPLLAPLPKPLWISAYDNSNIGAVPFADWIMSWLPKDVGLMFQDGVGLHTRTAESARHYSEVLRERLGPERFVLIAEAFRPAAGGGLRAATLGEIGPQLMAYRGLKVFVFDGPTYLSRKLVYDLGRHYLPKVQ